MSTLDAVYVGPLDEVQVLALGSLVVRHGQSIQEAASVLVADARERGLDVIEYPVPDDVMAGLLIQGDAWHPKGQAARELLGAVLVALGVIEPDGSTPPDEDPDAAAEAPAGSVEVPTTKRPASRARKE